MMKGLMRLSGGVHAGAVALVLGLFWWAKGLMDAAYAASQHPVDYFRGQTGFSAERIRGYHAVMQDAGTLDIYVCSQMLDFGFIASFFLLGLVLSSFVARFAAGESFARRLALRAGFFVMAAAVFDVTENLISLIMLENPQGFAAWLALPYSGAAVVKFGLLAAGTVGLVGALLAIAVQRLRA
ncbi:hypothetical protein OE750_05070 [Lentibacter sp. XHP0401]|nr:hypothetical protein [Lentibacter sp. XHP0401]